MADKDAVVNKEALNMIEDVVTCSFCSKLPIDPYQCSQCDSVFCKNCIEIDKKMQNCPNNCIDFDIKPSRLTRVLLSKLQMACPYNCGEVVPYGAYLSHINETCPSLNFKKKYFSLLADYTLLQKEHDDLIANRSSGVLTHQYKSTTHYHNLASCITNRLKWRCNICTKMFTQKDLTYYCTYCDFDLCKACKEGGY